MIRRWRKCLAVLALLGSPVASAQDTNWYLATDDQAAELYIREFGPENAPVVIGLHGGWGAEHSYMVDMLRPALGATHRVVLYDQRGSLLSPAAPETIALDRQIADLEQLRRALRVERVTLVAHSMGSFLALAYADRHPERVERLVLTGAIPARTGPGGAAAFWESATEYAEEMGERPEVARELASLAPDDPRTPTYRWRIRFAASNLFRIERWRTMPGGRAFYRQASADAMEKTMPDRWDFEPLLAGVPTYVIGGDHDYADPSLTYWRGLAIRNPQVHVTMVPRAAHSAWIDDATAFNRALVQALAE